MSVFIISVLRFIVIASDIGKHHLRRAICLIFLRQIIRSDPESQPAILPALLEDLQCALSLFLVGVGFLVIFVRLQHIFGNEPDRDFQHKDVLDVFADGQGIDRLRCDKSRESI